MNLQNSAMVSTPSRNNLDSAFPPFAPGIPVRSVYERAGFDVYRPKKDRNDSSSSIKSGSIKSPLLAERNGSSDFSWIHNSNHHKKNSNDSQSSVRSSKESWFRRGVAGSRASDRAQTPSTTTSLVPPKRSESRSSSAMSGSAHGSKINFHISPPLTPYLEQQQQQPYTHQHHNLHEDQNREGIYNMSYNHRDDMADPVYPTPPSSSEAATFNDSSSSFNNGIRPISTTSSVYSASENQSLRPSSCIPNGGCHVDSYSLGSYGEFEVDGQNHYKEAEDTYEQYQNTGDVGQDYAQHSQHNDAENFFPQQSSPYIQSENLHNESFDFETSLPESSTSIQDETTCSSSNNSMYSSQGDMQSNITSPGEVLESWHNHQEIVPMDEFVSVKPLRTRICQNQSAVNQKICRGCNKQIQGKCVSSKDEGLSGKWHRACFKCCKCSSDFESGEFYVLNDQPYCRDCYHLDNNSLCQTCGSGIEGQCLETFSDFQNVIRYHPHCLSCANCGDSLQDREYYSVNGTTLCSDHAFTMEHGPSTTVEKRRTRLLIM